MNNLIPTFDEIINRFEDAWNGCEPPRLDDFLPPKDHTHFGQLLQELIKIDMEYRWRRAPLTSDSGFGEPAADSEAGHRPFVEEYAMRFADVLDKAKLPIELIAEEYRIRRRWGDNPILSSYQERFPHQIAAIDDALKAVDLELSSRQSFVEKPGSHRQAAGEVPGVSKNRHTLAVGQQIDDFRLLNELGQGAFARVFLAQQISMQRLVALKVSDQMSLESPVLCQLEHPNIVKVFDERHVGSMYLMYMQYVPGGSLRDVNDRMAGLFEEARHGQRFVQIISEKIRAKGETSAHDDTVNPLAVLDWGAIVGRLGARIADALAHSHRLGVRHRDIKPENILLTSDGQPMLADFNLSFGASVQGASVEDAFGGSLAYMSPEHIRVLLGDCPAETVDELSDIFSLGVVLYELLHGQRPYEQRNDLSEPNWTKLDHLLARQTIPPYPQHFRHVELGLHALIAKCLAYSPADRPTSARQLSRQLQLFSIPKLKVLVSPDAASWFARWSKHPTAWYLVLGMLPNALLSPLNIWANHRIAIENFDQSFFHRIEEPVVNLVAFPLGILVAWWLALPISQAMVQLGQALHLDDAVRAKAASRSLTLPVATALLVLVLWAASGLVFPWWNQWASGSRVNAIDFLGFFLSQLLHGVIAACFSLVLVSVIALRAFYPRLIPVDVSVNESRQLSRLDQQLNWANACLEMTPLFAILAIALSDQFDKLVFVALAVVGFIGHLVAAMWIPKLRATIDWLQLAVGPMEELLRYQDSSFRRHS